LVSVTEPPSVTVAPEPLFTNVSFPAVMLNAAPASVLNVPSFVVAVLSS